MAQVDFKYDTFYVLVCVLHPGDEAPEDRRARFKCIVEVYARNVAEAAEKAADIFKDDVKVATVRRIYFEGARSDDA